MYSRTSISRGFALPGRRSKNGGIRVWVGVSFRIATVWRLPFWLRAEDRTSGQRTDGAIGEVRVREPEDAGTSRACICKGWMPMWSVGGERTEDNNNGDDGDEGDRET